VIFRPGGRAVGEQVRLHEVSPIYVEG